MAAAFLALLEVKSSGPPAEEDRFLGVLVKALFAEDRAAIPPVDVAAGPALLGNRCDAAKTLQAGGGAKAFALGSHAGQQARSEHRAGARKTGEEVVIFVSFECGGDSFIELGDAFLEELELAANEFYPQGMAFQDGGFICQHHGVGDLLQTLGNEFLAARAMEVIEAVDRLGLGLLQALEGRPFEEKSRGQRTPEIFAAEV